MTARVFVVLGIFLSVVRTGRAQGPYAPISTVKAGNHLTSQDGTQFTVARTSGNERALFVNSHSPRILSPENANDLTAARQAAIHEVEKLRMSFGLVPSADLTEVATVRTANVWRSSFAVSYDGISVRDASVTTMIGAVSGQLMLVNAEVPKPTPSVSEPSITSSVISSNVPKYLGEDSAKPITFTSAPKLIYVEHNASLALAYEVRVRQSYYHLWRITVDATTGALMEKKELLQYADEKNVQSTIGAKLHCMVHLTSPLDSEIDVGLPNALLFIDGKAATTDTAGNWTADVSRTSPWVVTGFYGPYASVVRYDARSDTAFLFGLASPYYLLWNDLVSHAAERDAFYHVNVARNYLRRLDTNLKALDKPIRVNVNLFGDCNASYDADSDRLNFLMGFDDCTNSAENPSIIYHEYGHRVAAARYANGPNGGLRNSALSEAFADLNCSFLRDDPAIGLGFFKKDKTRMLRTCANTKSFPKDINPDPHETGEIITGAFWDLRNAIGHDVAEQLFHKMEWLNPDAPDITTTDIIQSVFLNTLTDVLLVDDDDNDLSNGTPHSSAIIKAFAAHGIGLTSYIKLTSPPVTDRDTTSAGYPLTLRADYLGPIGDVDTTSLKVSYSTDDGKHYTSIAMQKASDSTYAATLPKVAAGNILSYYFSAALNVDSSSRITWPSPATPLSFTVGYSRTYFDPCETDRGWSLYQPSDYARSGLWTRGKPSGTYNLPGQFVQLDTDHTGSNGQCYITGNDSSPDISVDDVDSGAVTLTSNPIDLADAVAPVLRYWYYYSNDQGYHQGEPVWVTQISNDGKIWKQVQNTHTSTDGWTSQLVRVSNYVTPSSKVQLRFIASDYVGAIVEAGVDDVEAMSAPSVADVKQSPSVATKFGITGLYPNPASAQTGITLSFSLTERTHAVLVVKDVLGTVVANVVDEMLAEGSYTAHVPPLAAGTYWVVLSTPDRRTIQRIVIN